MALSILEIDELAAHLLGEDTHALLAEIMMERWALDYDRFAEIAEGLLDLTIPTPAPISGNPVHVFARREENHYIALARKEARAD